MVDSNNAINNTVGASISGVTNTFTITNPSDTASSVARETITVGGASAGDPSLNFNVSGVTDWEMGIDNNDSDKLKISQGTALGTNDTWRMTTAGERTMPLQPCFTAVSSGIQSNVTGDGTTYTVQFATELLDRNSDYDNTTFTFTAPVDGVYLFASNVGIEDLGAAHTLGFANLITTTQDYNLWDGNTANMRGSDTTLHLGGSVVCPMSATDTAHVVVFVQGGTKTVNVRGVATYFSGCLLA